MLALVSLITTFFIIPVDKTKTYTSGTNVSNIPEVGVNATTSQQEIGVNDTGRAAQIFGREQEQENMKRIEENMNKTDYNRFGHFESVTLPNIPGKVKANGTHVSIKDEKTGIKQIQRILAPEKLMKKHRENNRKTTATWCRFCS